MSINGRDLVPFGGLREAVLGLAAVAFVRDRRSSPSPLNRAAPDEHDHRFFAIAEKTYHDTK